MLSVVGSRWFDRAPWLCRKCVDVAISGRFFPMKFRAVSGGLPAMDPGKQALVGGFGARRRQAAGRECAARMTSGKRRLQRFDLGEGSWTLTNLTAASVARKRVSGTPCEQEKAETA